MSKIVSAHQPNFLPYLGFFEKMKSSDIFIIRDDALFSKRDFHHRNKIRVNGHDNTQNPQWQYLTVPVIKKEVPLDQVAIKRDVLKHQGRGWHADIVYQVGCHYDAAPHFKTFENGFKGIFDNSDEKLLSLSMKTINFLREAFSIPTPMVMATDLGIERNGDPSRELALMCEKLGADVYLSGDGGRDYLDAKPFRDRNIEVVFQDYSPPTYTQRYSGFLPNMSALDALFCTGSFVESKHEGVVYATI